MERLLYWAGLVFGLVIFALRVPVYEADTLIDRAFTGSALLFAILCLAALIRPGMIARDKNR